MYNNLREARKKSGITAKEICKRLELKTEQGYFKKETGAISTTVEEALILSKLFGVAVEILFFK